MQHQNSVFHQISKQIDWKSFESLVDEHDADRRVRRLNTKGQFLALLFAQLSGSRSLREVETGLKPALSLRGHNRRPFDPFRRHIKKKFEKKFSAGIRLLDATCITLPKDCADWCRHNGSQCGAKVCDL